MLLTRTQIYFIDYNIKRFILFEVYIVWVYVSVLLITSFKENISFTVTQGFFRPPNLTSELKGAGKFGPIKSIKLPFSKVIKGLEQSWQSFFSWHLSPTYLFFMYSITMVL